jgi:hypothetical protein
VRTILLSVSLIVGAAAATSCEPDEVSFVIEHVKAMPDPPACSYSVSDAFVSGIMVDLSVAAAVENAFLVKNQLMSTEDYNNLDAESNGILLDYYDVSVTVTANNANVGSSRINYNQYIAPESEDLITAQTIPASMAADLADEFGCLAFNEANYPADSMFENAGDREDRSGNPIPRYFGTVYASVRFFGHSQGGKDVSTQSFNFAIDMCCGCSINWINCDSECGRYCETPDEAAVCVPGVLSGGNLLDCRAAYTNAAAVWNDGTCLDDETGDVRDCNCNDDCSR